MDLRADTEHEAELAVLRQTYEAELRAERRLREEAEQKAATAEQGQQALLKAFQLLQQEYELLRRKLVAAKAERVDIEQLSLEFAEVSKQLDAMQKRLEEGEKVDLPKEVPAVRTRKPSGRRSIADLDSLPLEHIVLSDPSMDKLVAAGEAVEQPALDDVSWALKYRPATLVRLCITRKTYSLPKTDTDRTLVTATMPSMILERSIGTPSLFANIVCEKFERGLPFYRQEERFAQSGVSLDRGTMSRWTAALGDLVQPLIRAMRDDAFRNALCLSTDATGILVQRERDPTDKTRKPCKRGHYFVQIADVEAVFFEYTPRETSAAVLQMFHDFKGYIQADAKNVYDILFRDPSTGEDTDDRKEVGCWAHTRRKFFDAAAVAKEPVAREVLLRIQRLYHLDSQWKKLPPKQRQAMRGKFLRPELIELQEYITAQYQLMKDERGLLRSALAYANNHSEALARFLEDGRLSMDNNHSERALRRIAVGRKNWLFVGSDEHAVASANLMSLLATARMHKINPEEYLRDLFRVLPHWPTERLLELAPRQWPQTKMRLDRHELDQEIGPLTVH